MEAIKPCPFCGEPDALYCLPILAEYMVHCNTCSATGPRTVRHDDAILLWNAAANALEAAQAKTRDVLDAYTTVIAARDEDEEVYAEITRKLENEITRLNDEIMTTVETYNFRIRQYAQNDEYSGRRIKELEAERDEARKWAREYKRRLIAAAKAMRGDEE